MLIKIAEIAIVTVEVNCKKRKEGAEEMPYDGIVLNAAVWEINGLLAGGRIEKVFQTGKYEITLLCHSRSEKYRVLISAAAENAGIHLTKSKKENPLVAPPFAMVLRKHIQSGKIISLEQIGYDRIAVLTIETHNEMGDIVYKKLIIEIMGKHSNIILTSEGGIIFDSIKRVDEDMSSVREVMPGRIYMQPPKQNKLAPENVTDFKENSEITISKAILNMVSGFSPYLSKAICKKAGVAHNKQCNELTLEERTNIKTVLLNVCNEICEKRFFSAIIDDKEFHCISVTSEGATKIQRFNTVNLMLDSFYTQKDTNDRFNQKKNSLLKHINTAVEKCHKKLQIHESVMHETQDYEKYKQYGELITANMYQYPEFAERVKAINYYDENMPEVLITLDKNKSISQNAQIFFKKYRKNKTAYESAEKYLEEDMNEMDYLDSIKAMMENNAIIEELDEIRAELIQEGYLKPEKQNKKNPKKNEASMPFSPYEYLTKDGYTILIGRNNLQNEKLTIKIAKSEDMWFHVKNAPGSHVILKTVDHDGQVTAHSVFCAATLAAWFSSVRQTSKIDVDYTRVKNVRKQPGGRPGMVNYLNYKTITVEPNENPEADK